MTLPQGLTASDLAPGDGKSLDFDASRLAFHIIDTPEDPWLDRGYALLWQEFGPRHEMEQRDTILRRLAWDPAAVTRGFSFMYRMIFIEEEGRPAAVRDHIVILCHDPRHPLALVHLSHVWVAPEWRRSGLAGWTRALPILTARAALDLAGLPPDTPILLAAEMEHYQAGNEEQFIRLKAYEKAGFRRADPARIHYHQPDFRTPEEIDRDGTPKLIPMVLMLRAVGRESTWSPDADEILRIVFALYHMYSLEFRAQDMRVAYDTLKDYPSGRTPVRLELPTQLDSGSA